VLTLELDSEPHPPKRPREIDLPWSLLIIPGLLVLAGLAIPYALVAAPIQRVRERRFRSRMRALDRVMEWPDFRRAADEPLGTLIIERHSLKGPVRWWWTADNLYNACPFAVVNWLDGLWNDERYRPLAEWCHNLYTSPEAGVALLVDSVSRAEEHFQESAPTRKYTWIEVAPPDRLRRGRGADLSIEHVYHP
jgi:hypothetical protein